MDCQLEMGSPRLPDFWWPVLPSYCGVTCETSHSGGTGQYLQLFSREVFTISMCFVFGPGPEQNVRCGDKGLQRTSSVMFAVVKGTAVPVSFSCKNTGHPLAPRP